MNTSTTKFVKGSIPWNKGRGRYVACKQCWCEVWVEDNQLGRRKFCSKQCSYIGRELKGLFQIGHKDLVPKDSRGHSEETKLKVSKSLRALKKIGPYNQNWRGGTTKVDKLIRRMPEYILWRTQVFERDEYSCKNCGIKGYVTAHHKISLRSIIVDSGINDVLDARNCETLWDASNGVTLCESCHSKTDNYKGRGKISNLKNYKQ